MEHENEKKINHNLKKTEAAHTRKRSLQRGWVQMMLVRGNHHSSYRKAPQHRFSLLTSTLSLFYAAAWSETERLCRDPCVLWMPSDTYVCWNRDGQRVWIGSHILERILVQTHCEACRRLSRSRCSSTATHVHPGMLTRCLVGGKEMVTLLLCGLSPTITYTFQPSGGLGRGAGAPQEYKNPLEKFEVLPRSVTVLAFVRKDFFRLMHFRSWNSLRKKGWSAR